MPQSGAQTGGTSIPGDIQAKLPIDPSYNVVSYSYLNGEVHAYLTTSQNAMDTTTAVVQRLAELGYDSGDNPSRILEGVEYTSETAAFKRLRVKVTLTDEETCVIQLDGYEN
jgi:hypothetical protein